MQPLSVELILGEMMASPGPTHYGEFYQRQEVRHLALVYGALLIILQITWILGLWAGSKTVLQPEESTFTNAVKAWLLMFSFPFGACVALFVATHFVLLLAVFLKDYISIHPQYLYVVGPAMLILVLLLFISIPIKVYSTNLYPACAIVMVACALQFIAVFGLLTAIGAVWEKELGVFNRIVGTNAKERLSFTQRLAGYEPADEIERLLDHALQPIGPAPTLQQREAALVQLQQKLEARRRALNPYDAKAKATFDDQLNRYLRLRDEVIAERRAPSAAAVH